MRVQTKCVIISLLMSEKSVEDCKPDMLLKENAMPANPAKTLLSPDNHSLLMIDHQYLQMLTIHSHDASEVISHAVALVEAAAIFEVPMLTHDCLQGASGFGRASGRGE
jgi:hypothetical protein